MISLKHVLFRNILAVQAIFFQVAGRKEGGRGAHELEGRTRGTELV